MSRRRQGVSRSKSPLSQMGDQVFSKRDGLLLPGDGTRGEPEVQGGQVHLGEGQDDGPVRGKLHISL